MKVSGGGPEGTLGPLGCAPGLFPSPSTTNFSFLFALICARKGNPPAAGELTGPEDFAGVAFDLKFPKGGGGGIEPEAGKGGGAGIELEDGNGGAGGGPLFVREG